MFFLNFDILIFVVVTLSHLFVSRSYIWINNDSSKLLSAYLNLKSICSNTFHFIIFPNHSSSWNTRSLIQECIHKGFLLSKSSTIKVKKSLNRKNITNFPYRQIQYFKHFLLFKFCYNQCEKWLYLKESIHFSQI